MTIIVYAHFPKTLPFSSNRAENLNVIGQNFLEVRPACKTPPPPLTFLYISLRLPRRPHPPGDWGRRVAVDIALQHHCLPLVGRHVVAVVHNGGARCKVWNKEADGGLTEWFRALGLGYRVQILFQVETRLSPSHTHTLRLCGGPQFLVLWIRHTHAHTHSNTLTTTDTQWHTCTFVCTPTPTFACTHTHTHTLSLSYSPAHTQEHIYTHTHTNTI